MEYAGKGWSPIPMTQGIAKHNPPSGSTGRNGVVRPADIARWLGTTRPRNIGLRLDGVIGIDVDEYGNKEGADELAGLVAANGALPVTYSSTARGQDSSARIYFFRVPADTEFKGKGSGGGGSIDIIQRKHRYAVVHPSIHPGNGKVYQWYAPTGEQCGVPRVDQLPTLPDEWVAALRVDPKRYNVDAEVVGADDLLAKSDEHRTCELVRTADVEIVSAEHIGHDEMVSKQYRLLHLAQDGHAGVLHVLEQLQERFISYATEARGSEAEAAAEWARSFQQGVTRVQQDVPPDDGTGLAWVTTAPGCTCFEVAVHEDSDPTAFECVERYQPDRGWLSFQNTTDSGNAERVAQVLGGWIKYVSGLGWLVWNGAIWERNEDAVRELIRQMARRSWHDLAQVGRSEGDGPSASQVMHVRYLNSARGVDNTLVMLKSMPGVSGGDAGSWDAQPHLVTAPNGTIELRTGQLLPHRREDKITRMLQVEYRPDAPAPRWDKFMTEIFPGRPEVADYVQRLFGYSLTGFNSEQIFPVLYGKRGANGKSVMIDVLMDIFGPLATKVLRDSLNSDAGGKKETAVANLRGRRLAVLSETGADLQLDEAAVKEMTGDSVMQARELYGKEFGYHRTFQMILVTNHRPDFKSQGDALWRRVRLIEFPRFFEEFEREDDLIGKLLNNEAEGILAWLVRGAAKWAQAGKLEAPDSVLAATKAYQSSTDKLEAWLTDQAVRGVGEKCLASEAWINYKDWAEHTQGHVDFRSNRTFYAALEEKGHDKRIGAKKQNYLHSMRLMTDAEVTLARNTTDGVPDHHTPF
jgi:P4 family phage/plasmid primase-like protien